MKTDCDFSLPLPDSEVTPSLDNFLFTSLIYPYSARLIK